MNFFKKLALGLKRKFNSHSISYISEEKSFGNYAEEDVCNYIERSIPSAIVKPNILVETASGRTEVDCLIQYNNKIFIVEIKHWKGTIIEKDGHFISLKEDKYTDEIHEKEVKSPFVQVKRQVRLLKEMTNSDPWINTIVFFVETDNVQCSKSNIWFTNIHELILYIEKEGRTSYPNQIKKLMSKVKTSDFISSSSSWGERNLHCLIDEESLNFKTSHGLICKKDISKINITHHFTYDELDIYLKNGNKTYAKVENGKIKVTESGYQTEYSFAKIKNIIIGE